MVEIFPRAHIDNLHVDEARRRSQSMKALSYQVHVDLSAAADTAVTSFPVSTRIEVEAKDSAVATETGADLSGTAFLDYVGVEVDSVIINGRSLEISTHVGKARILLSGLEVGRNVIEIKSRSAFSRSGEGMHRYVDPADAEVYLYTQCEPADSKRIFPQFDQPDMKSRFTFSITGPSRWELRSNAPEIAREPAGDDLDLVRFAETETISSYLTAFIAGPYYRVSAPWEASSETTAALDLTDDEPFGLELGLLCRASLAQHLDAEELFTITRQGLDFYHQEFLFPLPWGRSHTGRGKYDQVFVPEYNLGAMENPGLVTFTESYIFDVPATIQDHEGRANTLLHEMAHMWFGDLVTMVWWSDLWLKESFAEYMGAHVVEEATDFTGSWVTFAISRKAWAYSQDQLPTTHPIVADIADLEAADQNFDGITYAKGASVLKQLAAYVGQDAFRDASRVFFARYAFSNASLKNFLEILTETGGSDTSEWAEVWLAQAGLPELSTEISGNSQVLITQQTPDPRVASASPKPHRIRVGLYILQPDGVLERSDSIPMYCAAQDAEVGTLVPGLELPLGTPRVILPNDEDLTYAKLRLDPESREAALRYPLSNALARATVWAALFSEVRDADISPGRYLEAVFAHGLATPEINVVSMLLRQLPTLAGPYTGGAQRPERNAWLANALVDYLRGEVPADARRRGALALAEISADTAAELDTLEILLQQRGAEVGLGTLVVDEELRWAFLQALSAHGRISADELDREYQGNPTARSSVALRKALASRPDRQVKASALTQVLTGKDSSGEVLSNDQLSAVAAGYRNDTSFLTKGYEDGFFDVLEHIWKVMSQGQATRVIRGLFPDVPDADGVDDVENEPFIAKTRQWLESHPDAPAALRRILIEKLDQLRRSVRVQLAS